MLEVHVWIRPVFVSAAKYKIINIQIQISLMIGNLHLAGLLTDNFSKKRKNRDKLYIYIHKLTEERKLLIRKKFWVSPGSAGQAEYVISCANYYTS